MYFSIFHYKQCKHTDLFQRSWEALNLSLKHLKHPHEQQLGPWCSVITTDSKSWKGDNVLPSILPARRRGEPVCGVTALHETSSFMDCYSH